VYWTFWAYAGGLVSKNTHNTAASIAISAGRWARGCIAGADNSVGRVAGRLRVMWTIYNIWEISSLELKSIEVNFE
jgi:hypothetical protein